MANKVRTHRGRLIDLDEIKIKNQETVAIGNMNVNARGDQIDEYGRVIRQRDEIARESNKKIKSTTNSRTSVISAFEDEDDSPVELVDDTKAIERNTKKPQSKDTSSSTNTTNKSTNNSGNSNDDKSSGTTGKDSKSTSTTGTKKTDL